MPVSAYIPKIQRLNCLDVCFLDNELVINLDLKITPQQTQNTEQLYVPVFVMIQIRR